MRVVGQDVLCFFFSCFLFLYHYFSQKSMEEIEWAYLKEFRRCWRFCFLRENERKWENLKLCTCFCLWSSLRNFRRYFSGRQAREMNLCLLLFFSYTPRAHHNFRWRFTEQLSQICVVHDKNCLILYFSHSLYANNNFNFRFTKRKKKNLQWNF